MSPIEPVWEPALEALPYPRRMRELALRARRAAGTPELREALAGLSARGPYERRTALHIAMAARDLPYLERVLAGPDMALRRAALRAVRTLPVSDDAAAAVLDDAPADLRRAFYRTLRHCGRAGLADRLLPDVRARWGDREAAALLPACTSGTVARLLPDLEHAVTAWRALAGRHPDALLARGRDRAHEWSWWRRCRAGLPELARRDPAGLLGLLEANGSRPALAQLPRTLLPALFRADAVRAARAVRRTGRRGRLPAAYFAHVGRLPSPELREFVQAGPYALRDLLAHVPPRRRAEVYDLAGEGGHPGLAALPLLALLPLGRAAGEARRMLDWHGSVWHSARSRLDDPALPLKLTAHLPYEEAAGPLREAALGGDPRLRGLARTLLVEATGRTGDAAALRDLVAELARRTRNERDPLRADLLAALASVPVRLLDDAFAAPLEEVAAAAVDARDSSQATRLRLRALADRLLAHAARPALVRWAIGAYARLVARHGAEALDGHRLDRVLPRGRERDLVAAVRPGPGEHEVVVALARALGRRAFASAALQGLLRTAVRAAPEPLAREAAALWLADPVERERRAAALVAADPSAIALPEVWRVVAGRRTDLLLPALERARTGRFGDPGGVPAIQPQQPGRWTPHQAGRMRDLLAASAGPVGARAAAVASLGRLPGCLDHLDARADGDGEPALAEAALEAMAVSDRPAEALAVLLRHARGPRSVVAAAALARAAAAVPPSRLGPVLAEALTGPDRTVAVRKQAARLIERLRVPGAAETLLRAWDDPGLHPDVRIAVAAALRRMPEDPRALAALGAAAGPYASEPLLRALFQAKPSEYAPAHRPAYAALVRRLGAAADGPGVRFRASKAFAAWVRWYTGDVGAVLAAVADPSDPAGDDELPVLNALVRAGSVAEEALGVLSALLAAEPGERARARVAAVAHAIAGRPDAPLARRVVEMLARHPLHVAGAADVALLSARLNGGDASPERIAEELGALAGLLRDRPVLAARVADRRLDHALGARGSGGPGRLLPAARALTARGDAASHLLAVGVVRSGGSAAGWAGEWGDLLDGLRRSPHVDVRQDAWNVVANR
ncbi:hypothetical protein [Actinomadura sp. NPDC000600]|uniref:hypothetical protein n=1 Tax=Actinomadura sp. NPDC000600 TaxID=3154262 RepID=UPI00339A77A7